jgi:catechol 2,3-dioxygenase-like lactoylglutathione lyase family enzyme
MRIDRLDHLVLTVADIDATVRFYVEVLGMEEVTFSGGRRAVGFGCQKINLHRQGTEIEPKAHVATPGSADLCFITATPLAQLVEDWKRRGMEIELGPVERTGATCGILSVYLRDPDRNLIEISNEVSGREV